MALPLAIGRFNKRVTNKVMVHLVGHGSFAEIEHTGRRSGRTFRNPVNAFRDGDRVTFALTYGPRVDWLRNTRAAGGCRLRLGREWLTLGPPVDLPEGLGRARVPAGPRGPRPRRRARLRRDARPGERAGQPSLSRPSKSRRTSASRRTRSTARSACPGT